MGEIYKRMKKSNVLILDDGYKYVILHEFIHEGKQYYQLIKVDNDSDFVFVERVGDELEIIDDQTLQMFLIQKIADSVLK